MLHTFFEQEELFTADFVGRPVIKVNLFNLLTCGLEPFREYLNNLTDVWEEDISLLLFG